MFTNEDAALDSLRYYIVLYIKGQLYPENRVIRKTKFREEKTQQVADEGSFTREKSCL